MIRMINELKSYENESDFLRKSKEIHGALIGGLHTDIKALLSIYEASNLAVE